MSETMDTRGLTPILNVSDLQASFAWFEKLGWKWLWDWGDPPDFGAVGSGSCEIFLCQNGQGGRGRSQVERTFGPDGSDAEEKGVWISVWVGDVDAVHRHCVEHGLDVTWPPTDMPWNVREMHVRHPDGHVLRIGRGIPEEAAHTPDRTPTPGVVRAADQVRLRAVPAGRGTEMQVLVGPDEGAPNFVLRRFRMGHGGGIPAHANDVEHEQYVLRGRARITIGDAVHEVGPDDTLYIPAGTPHAYEVLEAPFEFLCVVPNSADRIRLLGEPAG